MAIKGFEQMKDQVKHNDSRRKFLVKTSAVSLISTLPATSVWGACTVSGALSGGSKVKDDCTTIFLSNGRSPGFWKDADTKSPGRAIASVFPYLTAYTGSRFNCEKSYLMSVIGAAKEIDIYLGKNENGEPVFINIKDAFLNHAGEGLAYNLAAVYLNAVFGFYDSYLPVTLSSGDTINNGAELIAHLFALDVIYGDHTGTDAAYYGFTEGSTAYSIAVSGCDVT